MLPKNSNKNSWILSVNNAITNKISHHYFCCCSHRFVLNTNLDEPEAPDVLCPLCSNTYFINIQEFISKDGVRIYKDFRWEIKESVTDGSWRVTLFFTFPEYIETSDTVFLVKQDLLTLNLNKDGTTDLKIEYHSDIILKYSLFKNDKVIPLKRIMLDDAKEQLCSYILNNITKEIPWIDRSKVQMLSVDKQLQYFRFFLQHRYFQEHRFFFWKMEGLTFDFFRSVSQMEALHIVGNTRKEKIVKRALYQGYEDAMQKTEYYYPYSDYVFSKTIDNIDLLVQLYALHPVIKQNIFTPETVSAAIVLINFLKNHYTEKQIINLFTKDIEDTNGYKEKLLLFRDTLNMIDAHNAIGSLEKHFMKVKLTAKKLHDEMVRVYHIVSYELDAKEEFEYDQIYLSACQEYEGLEFRLPLTVKELSLWAKTLHSCMFGYAKRIHQHNSIIYGIFENDELMYAIELNGFGVVQAKGVSNSMVPDKVVNVINSWRSNILELLR